MAASPRLLLRRATALANCYLISSEIGEGYGVGEGAGSIHIPRLTEEMDELVDTRVVFNSYLSSFFNSPIQIVSL
jgi:hypothetical protein